MEMSEDKIDTDIDIEMLRRVRISVIFTRNG